LIGMSVVRREEEIEWQPHPSFKGIKVRYLLTKRDDGSDITCLLLMVPKGAEVPEHVHPDKVDMIYPLMGSGKQWVEDRGSFDLKKGMIVRIPMGKKHRTYGVTEDLVLLDIFSPATV